ncbi:MAG: endonuclease/exonuclease/phosphatase family protein [Acidimicrobiales bacterium]
MRRMLWLTAGWLLTAGVAVGFILRGIDLTNTWIIGLVGLSPLLIVPIALIVMCARPADSRPLRFAAFGAVVFYLLTFVNPAAVVGCRPAATTGDEVVIFAQNVQYRGGDPVQVASAIADADPDVLVLIEVWPDFIAALEAEPALDAYRYRATEAVDATWGLAIWSRFPLDDGTLLRVGAQPMLRTTVEGPTGAFTLHAVHTSAPIGDELVSQWNAELATIAGYDTSTPTVLAGDFNATADHQPFRRILDAGWTDVHEPKGCGYDATWPADRPFALLRIDHVLVTDHFDILGLELGGGNGGDHRSLTATIRYRPPAPSPG